MTYDGNNRKFVVVVVGFDDYVFAVGYIGSDEKVYVNFIKNGNKFLFHKYIFSLTYCKINKNIFK